MKLWWIVRPARDNHENEIPERSFLTKEAAEQALSGYKVVQREYEPGATFTETVSGIGLERFTEGDGDIDEDDVPIWN